MPRNLLNQGFNGRNLLNTGDGVTDVVGGDAINVVETDNQIHTVNLKISKQGASSSLADTDVVALETSGGVIQKITGANLKASSFSSNWTRSSGNIFPTVTGDTILSNDRIQSNTQADATYLDSLILQNTNSGTDILTYSFQIKDAGSSTAPDFGGRLNFEVVYTKGGGSTTNVYEVTFDGFMRILKRLEIVDGFTANSGEDYDFPSSGGTLVTNTSGTITGSSPISVSTAGVVSTSFTLASLSATSPIAYNNTTGVISTTFTPTSTDNMSGKTFTDFTTFNNSLAVKTAAPNTNVSGAVRFFERQDTGGTHFTDLHTGGTTHTLTDNRNVFLPDATGTVVLDSTNIWETQGTNIITPSNTSLTAIDLPNNCSIRNDAQDTQFIKFSHTTSSNETIELASNQVSVENFLMYGGNSAYYLQFTNGNLKSSFNVINVATNSYLERDSSSDWIQFKTNVLNINYPNIDLALNSKIRSASNSSNFIGMESDAIYINTNLDIIEGGSIRNDSDPTNDFISFRNNHLYINYATTEVIQGGKIANGSNPSNDFIQFNNDELAINHNNITFKQGASIKNASNSLSGFSFESDKITFATPVKIVSEYVFPFPDCYPLEVEGYYPAPDTTGSALYYQNVPSLGGRAIAINGDVNMSIYAEYGLYVHTGTEIWVASDRRIKKDIEKFNGGLDLLRQLEVKSYYYIDGKGKNTKYKEIGFIAQEVEQIYPKAITQNHEYIPNVYKKIDCIWSDFEGKFKMKSNDLNNVAGVDYKFFGWNEGDKSETKITAVGNTDNTFTFNKKWDNIFCIGNRVNDFNVLDKAQLFVINFSATKELDEIVKEQQIQIKQQEVEINNLKSQLVDIIDILSKNNLS
tara:strand:+ start:252 stop:2837 length:2586 start_codon:yes stop_codon:yes gene_type:complete